MDEGMPFENDTALQLGHLTVTLHRLTLFLMALNL
jgi:hypothetical protein